MNEVLEARDAFLTIEWEYLPAVPRGFRPVTIVWLDIAGNCGGSDLTPPNSTTMFSFETEEPWTIGPGSAGEVVLTAGHVNDGGVDLQLIRDGEVACDSVAGYGESAGYVDTRMMHISSMSECSGLTVQVGDKWSVKANYDFDKHEPMMEGSNLAPVMGIGVLYIAG